MEKEVGRQKAVDQFNKKKLNNWAMRFCLKCDRKFKSKNKFTKICPLCKLSNDGIEEPYRVNL